MPPTFETASLKALTIVYPEEPFFQIKILWLHLQILTSRSHSTYTIKPPIFQKNCIFYSKPNFLIFGQNISPPGTMHGNTKILIKFTKRWVDTEAQIEIVTYPGGMKACRGFGLENASYTRANSAEIRCVKSFLLSKIPMMRKIIDLYKKTKIDAKS